MVETLTRIGEEASSRLSPAVKPPLLVRVSGLPASGKTTLADLVSHTTGHPYLDVDQKRLEMFGSNPVLPEEQEKFQMAQSYTAMYRAAEKLLGSGRQVVLMGATFRSHESREAVASLAARLQVTLLPIALTFFNEADEERIVKERLLKRVAQGSGSNIRTYEDYKRVKIGAEPFENETLLLDAAKPPATLMSEFMQLLNSYI